MIRSARWMAAMTAALCAGPAHAAQLALPDSGETAWLLVASLLGLLLAVPGAWLVTAAPAGRDALLRTVPATAAALAAAALLYVLIGYSFAFDTTEGLPIGAFLGGTGNWMLSLMGIVREGTAVPETAFALYQFTYLAIAVALLCGALSAHVRGGWLVGFAALWSLIVFAPIARWLWGGGWIAARGGLDMAGGLVVFYAGGVSAVVALALAAAGNRESFPADPLARGAGAAMLLIGMLAIAGASTLGASDSSAVAIIVMLVSACTAMLAMAAISRGLDSLPAGPLARGVGAAMLLVGMLAIAGASTLGASDSSAVAIIVMLVLACIAMLAMAAISHGLDGAALATGLVAGTVGAAAAGDGLSMGGAVLMGLSCALAAAIGPRLMPRIFARHTGDGTLIALTGAAKTGAFLFAFLLAFYPFGGSGYADGMTMTGQVVEQLIAIIAVAGWSVIGTLIAALSIGMVVPMRAASPAP